MSEADQEGRANWPGRRWHDRYEAARRALSECRAENKRLRSGIERLKTPTASGGPTTLFSMRHLLKCLLDGKDIG